MHPKSIIQHSGFHDVDNFKIILKYSTKKDFNNNLHLSVISFSSFEDLKNITIDFSAEGNKGSVRVVWSFHNFGMIEQAIVICIDMNT